MSPLHAVLWTPTVLVDYRTDKVPQMSRVVVAVDPPMTHFSADDGCAIVVAGVGVDGRCYVLADRTVRGREPDAWARAVIAAYREFNASRVISEVNQGGDLIEMVLRQVDETVAVRKVNATRGKYFRAEPVSTLYAEGRVSHVGPFYTLERQMVHFGPGNDEPDRIDALVLAITDLMLTKAMPAVRFI